MTPSACFAGVIVRDLATSIAWYTKTLACRLVESGSEWAVLELDGGSRLELTAGDPDRPGLVFPSYGNEPGPGIMPGFNVDEPDEVAAQLTVARQLPDWVVVIAPDRVRVVLTRRDCDPNRGLVGFRWLSPAPQRQQTFLDEVGIADTVFEADRPAVVPLIRGSRPAEVTDPDGHVIAIVDAR
jgi:catechol 2,3-dioxygenase-like lactoylglutathione lyase family enzyme